ncbi:hypothetical protein BVI2075_150012 [Burkholderia vietnamiensis]|nr:hypothetical protein BVI2075_150012 [Burkholderia vietnamiensis]CAG9230557.1 hypothetical protein BVI1335_740008 [Burkholderia vietnamiensis]
MRTHAHDGRPDCDIGRLPGRRCAAAAWRRRACRRGERRARCARERDQPVGVALRRPPCGGLSGLREQVQRSASGA